MFFDFLLDLEYRHMSNRLRLEQKLRRIFNLVKNSILVQGSLNVQESYLKSNLKMSATVNQNFFKNPLLLELGS